MGLALKEKVRRLSREAGLSARQSEILSLILEGMQDKEIAEWLGITPRTVKFHVANVCRRLGVSSRMAIVRVLMSPQ